MPGINNKTIVSVLFVIGRFLCLLLFPSCIGIGQHDHWQSDSPAAINAAALDNQKINLSDSAVRLHFVGWHYFEADRARVQTELEAQGLRINADAPVLLEVILEQTELTHPLQKLGNVILTVASFTAIPLYERFEYRLTFRVVDAKSNHRMTQYQIENRVFTSLLALPVMPFYWPPDARSDSILEATRKFASTESGA